MVGEAFILNKVVRNVFMRILLLYSPPNLDEDEQMGQQTQLTQLLLVSTGKLTFPKYTVTRHHTIYQSRDDVLR